MSKQGLILFFLCLASLATRAHAENFSITTLNCSAFFGGDAREAVYLSQLAAARYHHSFQPIFAETKDAFTEQAVGDTNAALALLVSPVGPMNDAFVLTGGKFRTHASGKAYDRILISTALENGDAGWRFEKVFTQPHSNGKGAEKKLYTDHFPVTAVFATPPKK